MEIACRRILGGESSRKQERTQLSVERAPLLSAQLDMTAKDKNYFSFNSSLAPLTC